MRDVKAEPLSTRKFGVAAPATKPGAVKRPTGPSNT